MYRATLTLTTLALHLLAATTASAWTPPVKVNESAFAGTNYQFERAGFPKVTMTTLAPATALPGSQITVNGDGFTKLPAGTTLNFYPAAGQPFGAPATFQVLSDTQLRATVPAGARSGPLSLLVPSKFIIAPYNQPSVLATSTQSFQLASPPAAPSQLATWPVGPEAVQLVWDDNSSNETGFEVSMRSGNGAWVVLGTVAANTETEPITGLWPESAYTFRVRALSAFGPSGYSNTVSVTTLRAPGLEIVNGLVSPFFPGYHTPGVARVLRDANQNGVVDGAFDQAPNHPNNIFPVFNVPSGNGTQTLAGARFAPGANLIVYAEVATWSTMLSRTQFVAAHLHMDFQSGVVTPIAMVAGDLDATVPAGQPVVMGSSTAPQLLDLAGQTPTVVHPGWIEGTIQGEVGFQSPGGLYYNSLVTLDFGAALERF
jgi:hypothetical protein